MRTRYTNLVRRKKNRRRMEMDMSSGPVNLFVNVVTGMIAFGLVFATVYCLGKFGLP